MHARHWLLFTFSALIIAACGEDRAPQESFEKAKARVLSEVVSVETLERPVLVFALPEPLGPGDVIGAYQKEGYEPQPEPKAIEVETWFFWVDDFPGAEYVHTNRFVFVEVESGELTIQEEQWWPVLNGEGLWVKDSEYWDDSNWVFPEFDPGDDQSVLGGGKVLLRPSISTQSNGSSPGAAIVINGWEPGEDGEANFAANADQMVDILTKDEFRLSYFGPKNERIPENKRAGDMDLDAIGEWFRTASEQLSPGDNLVVYIASHGWVSEDGKGFLGGISDELLATYLANFDPGVNIVVVLQGCKSGSFSDDLRDVADLTLTATNATDPSYGDLDPGGALDIPDSNPNDRGSEFTSGFVEDWREIRGDAAQQEQAETRASRLGTNPWQETAALSFVSAAEKDAGYHKGWSFPQAVRGSSATRPTVLLDGSNDGVGCVSGEPLPGDTPSHVDIDSVRVSADPGTDATEFEITLSNEEAFDAPYFGGIEFYDPSLPISPPNPNWTFDGIGNINYYFQLTSDGLQTNVHAYDEETGWADKPEFSFSIELQGNKLSASIPNPYIPADAKFYVSTTDLENCDSVGLNEVREPIGIVPMLELDAVMLPGKDTEQDSEAGTAPAAGGDSLQHFDDPTDDVTTCPGGESVDDPLVDLTRVILEYDVSDPEGPLHIQAYLLDPGAVGMEEFSFAVLMGFNSGGETQQAFLYQYHNGEPTIGQIDPLSQALVTSEATIAFENRMIEGTPTGVFDLEVPRNQVPVLSEIPIVAYHMATAESARTCDELLILVEPAIVPADE